MIKLCCGSIRGVSQINSQERIIAIFIRLFSGERLTKKGLMDEYNKQGSTIQRDIATIEYLLENEMVVALNKEYSINKAEKGVYYLEQGSFSTELADNELLAILKILYSTRIFNKVEMTQITNKLLSMAEDKKKLSQFIRNEQYYYEGISEVNLLDRVTLISEAMLSNQVIEFEYTKNGVTKTFKRAPQSVYYSDMYFFMMSASHKAQDDQEFEALNKFRINNMVNLRTLPIFHKTPHGERFEGGVLRGQTTLPFLGNPITLVIDFYYDPVYVLDRFPDAKITKTNGDGSVRIEIKANDGYGVKMWLLGQGAHVKIVSPKHMKDYVIEDMKKTLSYYNLEIK